MINTVFIYEDVWEKLRELSDKHDVYETGGILLGEKNSRMPIVTELADPGPAAEGSHFSFRRDTGFVNTVLAETIVQSLGKIDYIGEWYIKPSNVLTPSSDHNRMLTKISADAQYNNRHPILLLCNMIDKGFRAKAYIYENKKKPRKVNINIVKKWDE